MFSSKDLFFTPAATTGYRISNSLRFRSSASAYLSRTPGSAGSLTTWTWSAWVKRGAISSSTTYVMLSGGTGATSTTNWVGFVNDTLAFSVADGTYYLASTAVYRDPSAWYHIVAVYDSSNATSSNRMKLYVNGVQITAFSTATYPTSSYAGYINGANGNFLGVRASYSDRYFDGYLAEVNFVDGQALTPSSFGANDATTGVWQPKAYTGTYGTNGFYLKFSDATSATTLSYDYSGNGNNWTPNNISVAAGVTYDSMIDTPTPYDDGGNGRGNYCVLNPLDQGNSTAYALNGNLTASGGSSNAQLIYGGMGVSSGKWYWETTITAVGGESSLGVSAVTEVSNLTTNYVVGSLSTGYGYYFTGNKYNNGSFTSYGLSYTTGDVIGVAFDADAGSLTFYKNNVSQGVAFSSMPSRAYKPAFECRVASGTSTQNVNFGQRPFAYTPPSGFKALNTQNLPTPTIANGAQYMDATTYTGTGSTLAVTNTGSFQPDFVWVKQRGGATSHVLQDVLRGAGKTLFSNATNAESGNSGDLIASFNSNGFTVNNTYLGGSGGGGTDGASGSYVGWQWKANGAGSSNTSGSITSTVSANVTAGFSVVTFTGTGAAGISVGHGLGVTPAMMIVKSRGSTGNWLVYHKSLGNTGGVALEQTSAFGANAGYWNNTSPTSSVFTLGTFTPAATAVAYCFAEVAGYSAFGSYTGNGSVDGPFVYTGFRPRYVLSKRTDTTSPWQIIDTSRDTYNSSVAGLFPNTSGAEASFTQPNGIDYLSNGFKLRNSSTDDNASGGTYIYAAFCENPFKYSLAR